MASDNSRSAPKKPKLVRDSFTIPKTEYAAIDALKTRAIGLGTSVKKSELIRAGLMALQGLSDAAYKAALAAVPTLKTGRPLADKPADAAPAAPAARKPARAAAKATRAPARAPAKTAKTTKAPKAAPAPAPAPGQPAGKAAATAGKPASRRAPKAGA